MADGGTMDKARFGAMTESTAADWMAIGAAAAPFKQALPDRLIASLQALGEDTGGFAVTRLEHSLQTATRAMRDGRDEEYVVCALMHDIGDLMGPANHAEIGAVIMKPYISEANWWMMDKHGVFQGYYFFHHIGLDRDMREQYRGHPHFEYAAQFCHLYDQASFDPGYESMPLAAFEPMLRRVVETPKQSIYRRAGKASSSLPQWGGTDGEAVRGGNGEGSQTFQVDGFRALGFPNIEEASALPTRRLASLAATLPRRGGSFIPTP